MKRARRSRVGDKQTPRYARSSAMVGTWRKRPQRAELYFARAMRGCAPYRDAGDVLLIIGLPSEHDLQNSVRPAILYSPAAAIVYHIPASCGTPGI